MKCRSQPCSFHGRVSAGDHSCPRPPPLLQAPAETTLVPPTLVLFLLWRPPWVRLGLDPCWAPPLPCPLLVHLLLWVPPETNPTPLSGEMTAACAPCALATSLPQSVGLTSGEGPGLVQHAPCPLSLLQPCPDFHFLGHPEHWISGLPPQCPRQPTQPPVSMELVEGG